MARTPQEMREEVRLFRQLLVRKSDMDPTQIKAGFLLLARQIDDIQDAVHLLTNKVQAALHQHEQDELMASEIARNMMKKDRP